MQPADSRRQTRDVAAGTCPGGVLVAPLHPRRHALRLAGDAVTVADRSATVQNRECPHVPLPDGESCGSWCRYLDGWRALMLDQDEAQLARDEAAVHYLEGKDGL